MRHDVLSGVSSIQTHIRTAKHNKESLVTRLIVSGIGNTTILMANMVSVPSRVR